jgi:hypothetical protein
VTLSRRSVAAVVALALASLPPVASARATIALDGGTLVFFADTLGIVARDGATLRLPDGTRARADAAFVDLKSDRVVLAGHARIDHGSASASADAIALDLDADRVDLLDAASGATSTTHALRAPVAEAIDGERFAFPEVDDGNAYIRSRHAVITPHASARFVPAAFPTSVGGLPVPSYLYTYATAAGFGATSLAGAAFDQPYGLFGTQNSLTALHARWIDGLGPSVGLQQQLVNGDQSYVAASVDAPLHGSGTRGLNAYDRLGSRYTASLTANDGFGFFSSSAALTAAFGAAGGRVTFGYDTGGYTTFDASLRTPDLPLFWGATWRLQGDVGYDALRGGLLTQLPDARDYSLVWRHGIDAFVATPIVHAPLGVRIGTTFDANRTWYAFPHHNDSFTVSSTASRELSRKIALFAGYAATWYEQIYPGDQGLFFPGTSLPSIAPDGTPWPDHAAYTGATTLRDENLALQLTPDANTSVRVTMHHYDDFPQYHGYGRPQWALLGEARFRPFPNIGIDVGREYDFGWGGYTWQPRWTFAVMP